MNDILERLQQLFPGDPDVDLALPAAAWLGGFGDYYIELGMLVRMLEKTCDRQWKLV